MIAHIEKICAAEGVTAEPEALTAIARVAEGSVRDALSLLDQAIAHGGTGGVSGLAVREMIGLSDRGEIVALFERAMNGEPAEAVAILRALYHAGAEPLDILLEVAEFCHLVTYYKIAPDGPEDLAHGEAERRKAREFAGRLTLGALTRGWQILLKGYDDVKDSPRPLASAEMALIRLAYASDLPSPEDALRKLAESSDPGPRRAPPLPAPPAGPRASLSAAVAVAAPRAERPAAAPPVASPSRAAAPGPSVRLARFEDVVALARAKRDLMLVHALEHEVRLARFEEGSIAFSLVEGASSALAQTLARRLQEWTGQRWMVALTQDSTRPTLRETQDARDAERTNGAASHPVVREVLERFRGAKIVDIRLPEAAAATVEPPPVAESHDDDIGYGDADPVADDDF